MSNSIVRELHSLTMFGIKNHPELVTMQPLIVGHTTRKNDKRSHGTLEIACHDDWVKNITGNEKLLDTYYVVRVDASVVTDYQKILSPEESPSDTVTETKEN